MLARSIPVIRAIRDKIGEKENLILYSSTRELIERLKQGFPKWHVNGDRGFSNDAGGWDATTAEIGNFLHQVVQSASFQEGLVPRLHYMRLLEQHNGQMVTALKDREAWIQEIYDSWSWRLTSPMRQIGDAFLRMRGKR